MSGLFISRVEERMQAADPPHCASHLCFTDDTQQFRDRASHFEFQLTWIKSSGFQPVYHRPEVGVSLLMLGRLYDVARGRRLDKEFSRIAQDYAHSGLQSLYPIDGAGALVLFDHHADRCALITDPMGFLPLYVAYPEDVRRVKVASHPDVLAASFKQSLALDEVTMGEFLMTWRSAHPHTYYQPIRQLDPGSVYEWDEHGFHKVDTYFPPEPRMESTCTIDGLAKELADALREAVNVRLNNVDGRAGLLLSGGLDSRAILFSNTNRNRLVAITFYSLKNRESTVACELARLASVPHVLLQRGFDYYAEAAARTIRISGGMWDWRCAHTTGFTEELINMGLDLLLTGCYTDYLFKGLALDTKYTRPWRYAIGVQRLCPFKPDWYGRFYPICNPLIGRLAQERLDQQYAGVHSEDLDDEERKKLEIRRLCPMSREAGIAFRSVMWRTLPFDLVNSDSRLIDLFMRIPPQMKLNKLLYLKALRLISPACMQVRDSNTGTRPDSGEMSAFLGRLVDKVRYMPRRFTSSTRVISRQGAWLDWPSYVDKSSLMQELWKQVAREHGDAISHVLAWDPFKKPWPWLLENQQLFHRVLTLGLWLTNRIK